MIQEFVESRMAFREIVTFRLDLKEQMCGYVELHCVDTESHWYRIVRLAVANGYRRRGIGKILMEAAENFAVKQRKCVRLDLLVYSTNENAKRLYSSIGWRHDGALRSCSVDTGEWFDVEIMSKVFEENKRSPHL